jgi:anthranilate synthase component 1
MPLQGPKTAGSALGLRRALPRAIDPVALFAAQVAPGAEGTALLETAEAADQGRPGRSLIVLRSALALRCRGGEVEVRALTDNGASLLPWLAQRLTARELSPELTARSLRCNFPCRPEGSEEARISALSPIDAVRELMLGLDAPHDQPQTSPICVGTFAYDLIDSVESLPQPRSDPHGWPDFELFLADRAIWTDAERGACTLSAQVFGGDHAQRSMLEAVEDLRTLVEVCQSAPPPPDPEQAHRRLRAAKAARRATPRSGVDVDLSDDDYAELVSDLKRHIVAGDVFQIVPSRAFRLPCPDPLAAYRVLRADNPSPYMFFVNGAEGCVFGASPETAVRVGEPRDGQRRVVVRPIAGTRPRGRHGDGAPDHDLDGRLEAELRLDEKEVAEHMMLVDLARNDVARVAEAGTRQLDRLLTVERYSHVMHLVSQVSGELRADLDALHAYVATMNMGTLVGAPKIRAAQLLREREAEKRAVYGGAVGYITADGRLDSAIVIRSALVQGGVATVRAGAGVVADSEPHAEADETRRKAQAVLDAIALAEELTL